MTRRLALAFLAVASPLILLTFLWGHPAGGVLFALLAVVFPVALIVLGAGRQGRLGPLAWPLGVLLLILVGCMVGMLLLRGQVLDGPWFGGLPLSAALLLYGLLAVPLVIVSLAYGLTFDRYGLRQDDLDRLRRLGRKGDGGEG